MNLCETCGKITRWRDAELNCYDCAKAKPPKPEPKEPEPTK